MWFNSNFMIAEKEHNDLFMYLFSFLCLYSLLKLDNLCSKDSNLKWLCREIAAYSSFQVYNNNLM